MEPSASSHTIDLTVRFAETDAMGIVHHSNHLIWFEAARVAWLDAVGMPYAEFATGGHHFAVTAAQVQYRRAVKFGDTVRVTAWLTELRSRQLAFEYEVTLGADDTLLATGRTEHVCVDLLGRTTTIPQTVLDRLQRN